MGPDKGKGEKQNQSQKGRCDDANRLERCVLKMEGGAMSQDMQGASRNWKRHENRFSP